MKCGKMVGSSHYLKNHVVYLTHRILLVNKEEQLSSHKIFDLFIINKNEGSKK